MIKSVRKAVRTLLIKDNKILVIKYKTNSNKDYYDLPGGKIEENESSQDAAIREFKEETGIIIYNPILIGNVIVDYPNRIFDFDVYKVDNYDGYPHEFEDNSSMWININDLLKNEKNFPCIEMLKYLDDKIYLKIISDEKHIVTKVEKLSSNIGVNI